MSLSEPLAPVLMVLVPVVFVVLIILLIQSSLRNRQVIHEEYLAFAKQVGGQFRAEHDPLGFSQPREVRFEHGKSSCSLWVDMELTGERHGEHLGRIFFMRMSFNLHRPTLFGCHIAPQWLPKILTSVLRSSDVRLGWDEFDRRFIVQTNDELRAPDILFQPVQEQLLIISQAAAAMSPLENGHVTLTIAERTVEIRMKGLLQEVQQLLPYYQLCGRLYDLLTPRLP